MGIVAYLSNPDMPAKKLQELMELLREKGAKTAAFAHLHSMMTIRRMPSRSTNTNAFGGGMKLLAAGMDQLNFLKGSREPLVCSVVESLVEQKQTAETESYLY